MNYSVSIIIPTYNRAKLLRKAIESALKQDYAGPIFIVITDDGSTDETQEVVRYFQRENSNVFYIQNKKYFKGTTGNKNNGLDFVEYELKTDFFAILDDDDELMPDAISSALDIYFSNNKYEIIIGNCIDSNGKFTGRHYSISQEVSFIDFICERFSGEYFGITKTSLLKGRRFDEKTWGGGEWVLWYQLWKDAKVIFYIHKILRKYNIYGDRVTKKMFHYPQRQFLNYKIMLDLFGEEILEYCPKIYAKNCLSAALFAKVTNQMEEYYKYLKLALTYDSSLKTKLIGHSLKLPLPILKFIRIRLWKFLRNIFF